ncbi:DUF732 domain-containing protein [Mycolicibacterium vinylchloridicum]|uniref:DUF732 domain-containing protein n=1 Tax=Mycolicibacterium vinylchloridicum TaxID=2736928 RepID=UPI0015CCA11E|nr:DUF732 domain-containing protein [Mycolicibacterium vinylchloridicum]
MPERTEVTFWLSPTTPNEPIVGNLMTVHKLGIGLCAVTSGILVAATAWPAPANADTTELNGVLNAVGIGNGGPITQLIEQIGQQICPFFAKSGSGVVSNATEASGYGGLASQVTGFVAEQAIQSQCPSVMTQLANGNFAPLMQMLSTANQASGTLNSLSGAAVPSVTSQAGVLSP